jgi:RNA recognition motif-containing protein
MQTIEEAQRAVEELHDKEFLGRRLVVSGAKSDQHQPRQA